MEDTKHDIEDDVGKQSSSGSSLQDSLLSPESGFGKTVWRKMDLCLLPVVTMFYFLSFLVRGLLEQESFSYYSRCSIGSCKHKQRSRGWSAKGPSNDEFPVQYRTYNYLCSLYCGRTPFKSLAKGAHTRDALRNSSSSHPRDRWIRLLGLI